MTTAGSERDTYKLRISCGPEGESVVVVVASNPLGLGYAPPVDGDLDGASLEEVVTYAVKYLQLVYQVGEYK